MKDALAWYGAIVSTASIVVAFLAWRSAGPRIKARAVMAKGPDGWRVHVRLTNGGRADVSVDSLCLVYQPPFMHKPVLPSREHLEVQPKEGPELPHRLLAASTATWCASMELLNAKLGRPARISDKLTVLAHTARGPVRAKVKPVGPPDFVMRWAVRIEFLQFFTWQLEQRIRRRLRGVPEPDFKPAKKRIIWDDPRSDAGAD
ncbi:hypothetical protein AB0N38_04245 [Micromonospora aurantiaca]|uniref:hypothetical protein n=1 Tax=Micromonospora aurantiaca (nom. illeg.) TaxID=47850 RepID=UPI0034357DB9